MENENLVPSKGISLKKQTTLRGRLNAHSRWSPEIILKESLQFLFCLVCLSYNVISEFLLKKKLNISLFLFYSFFSSLLASYCLSCIHMASSLEFFLPPWLCKGACLFFVLSSHSFLLFVCSVYSDVLVFVFHIIVSCHIIYLIIS